MAGEPYQGRIEGIRWIVVEGVQPQLDCGRYAVKREVGDTLQVSADVFRDERHAVAAAVRFRAEDEPEWREARMRYCADDRWMGEFPLERNVRYHYTVVAWTDWFGTWRAHTRRRWEAEGDVEGDLLEGARQVRAAIARAREGVRGQLEHFLLQMSGGVPPGDRVAAALGEELLELMDGVPDRWDLVQYDRVLAVQVDRVRARFAAWYELFPRSASDDRDRHGTFDDVVGKLPYVRDMGFDVLYLPPIHPIGRTHRKGKNNSLVAGDREPGSPYAIGSEAGGHKAVHPELGTLDGFRRLVAAAAEHGLEVALDIAIQVSPDHPYVKERPGWFYVRADGTIRHAENPPRRYQDIYALDFYGEGFEEQWEEWRSVFLFWVEQGVKTFRVDNPHLKPLQFWVWAIRAIQREHPEVVFLSEALTRHRPKVARALAKAGFTQSYSFFTWRNVKEEIEAYFTELTRGPMKEYNRANLFPNTPDINPEFLQKGGRPAFTIRAVLAATLSSVYGIYSGFELCEAEALAGTEEHLNSEKFEIRARNWDCPGNIRPLITRLNQIRRESPALQEYENLRFLPCDDDHVVFYEKAAADWGEAIFVAITLDPFQPRVATIVLPPHSTEGREQAAGEAEELLVGAPHIRLGTEQRIRLSPDAPARIWRVRR